MGSQEDPFLRGIKGIPHIPGRMSCWHIEQFEIIELSFDFGRFEDLKTHLGEDGIDSPQGLSADMEPAYFDWPPREGNIDPILHEGIPLEGFQCFNPLSMGTFQSGFYLVGAFACLGTFFSREFADLLKDLRKLALPPKVPHSPLIELR
jgi:hypothetical protein